MRSTRVILCAAVMCALSVSWCGAEQRYLESAHFIVSYPEEIEGIARSCAAIAEETATDLAPLFGYQFRGSKIVIDLHDESDFSNGAARQRQKYVRIDIRKTDMPLRGETPWLRNVLAHELSHTYTINVLKRPRYVWLEYGIDLDKDGIEGDGSVLVEHNRMPAWFLEALSQVGSYRFGSDSLDPYREMLLRDSFLSGHLLSLRDMARFERSSRDRELVYNQGFFFLRYMLETNPDVVMERFLAQVRETGLEMGVRTSFGTTLADLHEEWKTSLADRFSPIASKENRYPTLHTPRKLPLILEPAGTADGRYVVANWGEDYQSYALYQRRGLGGSYRKVTDDVGTVLRQDRATGAIWFNKLVFRAREKDGQFELFRLDPSGSSKQVLSGTRTRAFDVYDDRVVFASYGDGITTIEELDHGTGDRRVLFELPAGTAVYSLSLFGPDTVLASVGDGERVRLFATSPEGRIELWPELNADVRSPIDVGDGRMVFSSTLDGTPQLYLASSNGDGSWKKLTTVTGGVLHPVGVDVEVQSVVCSIWEDGSLRLRRVPLSDGVEVATSSARPAGPRPQSPSADGIATKRQKGMMVPSNPTWILEHHMDDDEYDAKRTYVHQVTAGAAFYANNATDTLGIYTQAGVDFFLGKGEMKNFHPFLGLSLDLEAGPGTLLESLELSGFSYYSYDDPDQYAISKRTAIRSETAYWLPVSFYSDLTVGYSYVREFMNMTLHLKKEGFVYPESLKPSLEVESGSLYARHVAYLSAGRNKGQSTYDPARLGNAGTLIEAEVSGIMVQYLNKAALGVDPADDPATALEISTRARARALTAGRKLSITSQVRGIGYIQPEIPDPVPFFLYESVGRMNLATGYDYFYPAYYYGQLEVDLRVNPFHNPHDAVRWYERWSLGVRGEGGVLYTIEDGDLEAGYPMTLELALRGGILVSPVREASWYCRVALPLYDQDFFDTEFDYRIYVGFSL